MIITFKFRLLFFFLSMLFFIVIFYVGFSVKIDKSFSVELSTNFKNQIHDINNFGIFLNNLKISLVMFIPIIGFIAGSFSAFSTGLVFKSIMTLSANGNYNPIIVFLTPFGILELISYGLAISRGGILLYELSRKKVTKKSILYMLIEIGIVCVLLFIGAIIEWSMIENISRKI